MRALHPLWLLLIALALVSGCLGSCMPTLHVAETPQRIFHAQPLIPEAWYEDIHKSVEKCAHKRKSYKKIEWYVVPSVTMSVHMNAQGLFSQPNRIYLDESFVGNGELIRHELAHYIFDGTIALNDAHNALFQACATMAVAAGS